MKVEELKVVLANGEDITIVSNEDFIVLKFKVDGEAKNYHLRSDDFISIVYGKLQVPQGFSKSLPQIP